MHISKKLCKHPNKVGLWHLLLGFIFCGQGPTYSYIMYIPTHKVPNFGSEFGMNSVLPCVKSTLSLSTWTSLIFLALTCHSLCIASLPGPSWLYSLLGGQPCSADRVPPPLCKEQVWVTCGSIVAHLAFLLEVLI